MEPRPTYVEIRAGFSQTTNSILDATQLRIEPLLCSFDRLQTAQKHLSFLLQHVDPS